MQRIILLLSGAALLVSSCNGPSYEKGKLVSREEYGNLSTVAENDGKRFAIRGYPFIDGDITTGNRMDPQISVYSEPLGEGTIICNLGIPYGKGKNEFYVPETFTIEDVIFYDNEGNELKANQEMEFSFTIQLQTERERMKLGDQMRYYSSYEDVRIDKVE